MPIDKFKFSVTEKLNFSTTYLYIEIRHKQRCNLNLLREKFVTLRFSVIYFLKIEAFLPILL